MATTKHDNEARPESDRLVADLLRRIRLAQNGVVAERMTRAGNPYRRNYGVAVPTLREMARCYEPDHDLAQRLWQLGIRETMILATLLEPPEACTLQLARQRIDDFRHIELVEQACMNLFSKMPQARELCIQLLSACDDLSRTTAFVLVARICSQLPDDDIPLLLSKGIEWSDTDNLFLYRAIALGFVAIARRGCDAARQVETAIKGLAISEKPGSRYIAYEVTEEMAFL